MQNKGHLDNNPNVPAGVVRVYAYYRFLLATLLLGMFLAGFASNVFGTAHARVFLGTASIYFVLTTVQLSAQIWSRFRSPLYIQFINLLLDIVALNLLMYASGGLNSGLGFLLLVTVATGSLIFTGQLALLLAACASILVIVGAILNVEVFGRSDLTLVPAGMLGALLFVIALLFRNINKRLQDSQSIALREADQAAHLQRLNTLIINRMRTGIILVDASAEIKLINSAAIEHLGGHKPGSPLAGGRPLQSIPELYKQYERWTAYPWLRNPPISVSGTDETIQCNFASLEEEQGRHTIIFIEDTRSTAQSAQQLKLGSLGRLAASMAHEIRNPLGAISHAAQLLEENRNLPEDAVPLTDIISRHSARVNQIIDSILQLSRQQAPEFKKLNLADWLKHYANEHADATSGASTIEISGEDAGIQVLFDPLHLNQVVTNLVENAQRYSREASGDSWAHVEFHRHPRTLLPCLDVFDRGPGVDDNNVGQIFEPFFTTSHSGTGLGLYLAKEHCEFNYATLSYVKGATDEDDAPSSGFFRITFAHPDQLLPGKQHAQAHRPDR